MVTTFSKRNKEKMRQERQKDKAEERQRRKQARKDAPPPEPGVDPDIAGIIPGPQPIEGVDGLLSGEIRKRPSAWRSAADAKLRHRG